MDVALPRSRAAPGRREWSWLRRNARLPAGVKLVLGADLRPHVRFEVPRAKGRALGARLTAGEDAVRAIVRDPGRDASSPSPESRSSVEAVDPATLCAETGWPFHPEGTTVALDVPNAFLPAEVAVRASGEIAVSVAVATWPEADLGELGRRALGLMLLTVSGGIRLVRASASERSEGRVGVDLSVVLPSDATAIEVADALTVLSLGARFCAAEARAFEDEELAGEYLALRGRSPREPTGDTTNERGTT
jgi:hypothetical protein